MNSVLVYHSISSPAEALPGEIDISPENFDRQMNWLARWRQVVPLTETLNPNSGRYPVALTFDDGFRDNLTVAVPILEKAMRLDPEGKAFYMVDLGVVYLFLGRYEEAAQTLETHVAAYPNNVNARAPLCVTYTELGRERDARAQAAEILRLNPRFKSILSARLGRFASFWRRYDADLRKAGLKSCVSEPDFAARCRG